MTVSATTDDCPLTVMREEVEASISAFIAKYDTDIASRLRAARKRLRSLFPRGYELVYDNYNALVFGIGSSERASDALISVAGYPRWVTLFFLQGADLRDPRALLKGSGSRVRSIRLEAAEDLDRPAVLALIDLAVRPHAAAFAAAPKLSTLIKSVSAKQRPRRKT